MIVVTIAMMVVLYFMVMGGVAGVIMTCVVVL
jgi:hypothetical protein